MQISALTDIVEGKLLNFPSISFITQAHTNIKKVNEGDAYLAKNPTEIQNAIKQGAFAIILDFDYDIIDNEIAWIKVPSLTRAITNILRYKLLKFETKFIYVNKIFFNLLNIFKTKVLSDVILIQENISENFEILNNLENNKLIFGTNLNLLNTISGEVMTLENKNFSINNLTSHSLFETSFSHKDKFFDKIKLPTLYINDLLYLLELFDYNLDFKRLNNFNLFKPVFVNKSKQMVPYGQTNRFILANSDDDISDMEITYLKAHYSYGTIKELDTANLLDEEIYQTIKKLEFNALYCRNSSISKIIFILEKNYTIDTLII
ncbi:hypothetical protein N9818_00690 [Arcobacteraceae bacterium]|nr:hypothetical protein [Arcobacteraceae bacterium]